MKKKFNNTEKNKKLIKVLVVIAVIFVSAMFVGEAFQGAINTLGTTPSTQSNTQPDAQGNVFSTPTYTNGTYKVAEVGNPNHLNIFEASTVCDFELLDEIYDTPYNFFPNETVGPWLATGVTGYSVAGHNITTVDPLNGTKMNVNYIYTLHIRSGVKWQDWTSANSGDTYLYPLNQTFMGTNGKSVDVNNTIIYDTALGKNITLTSGDLRMQTHDVQSADFILSWEILFESEDLSSEYPSIVNIVPVNNLTVEYYLSTPVPISLFKETALDTDIIPYHIWDSHAYASVPGLWNYSSSLPASGAYNTWNLGYNAATGYAPGLVGSGPYMMYGGFGQPKGAFISSDYWQLYVNPDYFVQYVPSLSQFTPKVYSIYAAIYTSDSAAVASLSDGQTYAMLNALPATFIPTVKGIPSSYIYDKAGTGYGYQQVSSYAANAPFNITDLRVALEYAIPKTYLASVVAEGYSIPGPDTPVPDSDILWQASGVPYYHFDLTTAKSYIDAAINATRGLPFANQLSYSSAAGSYKLSGTTLYYGGKPVTQTIQITSASEDPLGVEGANKIATYWTDLGISTTVKEESFSTLIANLVSLSPSDQTSYQAADLACSGWELNPADDLAAWENSYLGSGTGVYKGPFTTFDYTSGPSFAVNLSTGAISTSSSYITAHNGTFTPNMTLIHDTTYNGSYLNHFMNKLVNESYVETNVTAEHVILDVLQYVLADQATFENLGYSVDPMAIVNSTFTGIDHDSLALTGFWYWNFMDIHLKKPVIVTKPVTLPYQLEVGVISNSKIYYSGQYGNLTIQVRNQYGQAMPNIPVSIGYIASDGGIVNITSVSGKTNSNGIYHFEFLVTPKNEAIYTSDYAGDVQFTVTAIAPNSSYVSGKGSFNVDVEPYAVAYKIVKYPDYISIANNTTSKTTMMELKVYNPLTGTPISGYQYTVESLSGLVQLVNTTNQVLTNTTNRYMFVDTTGLNGTKTVPIADYNMTKITGTTNSTGDINIMMEYNSSFDWNTSNVADGFAHTYIFMGDYSGSAPMAGLAPYMDLGQVTSSMNPSGFGVIQPFEIPVMVNESSMHGVHISVSYKGTITNNGTEMMTLTATQDGKPLSNYNITVTAQNALGANRGLVYGTSTLGTTSATDPNSAFGSTSMPEYTVTTNSAGVAYVNFTASEYTYNSTYAYKLVPFSSTHLVPYDEFQLGIMGMNATGAEYSAATSIVSTPFEFNNTTNPYIFPTATVYLLGASYSNGSYFILSDHKYTMYINSTYNTAAGPSYKDLSFTASTNYGHISVSKGSTGSSGSYKLTYTSKPVTTITKITVTLTLAGSGQKEAYTFYVLPHKAPSYTLYYAIIGVVAVIAAIFIAMYAISMRKLKAAKK